MSSHTRAIDAITRLSGELTVDEIFFMRRKPWHAIAVAVGVLVGLGAGAAVGIAVGRGQWFFVASFALVLGGLGMNVGADFCFLALTPSRLLLVDSSRVIAQPVRKAVALPPGAVSYRSAGPFLHVVIDGRPCLTSRSNRERLERMLAAS
jgi:hypothetical protein